ncbi:hypothetical protein KI387_004191, partial [Taxus chinensis]
MEEGNMDVKGSKLVLKIVNLWKRLARSDGRSRYSRLNTPTDPSCTCSCSDSNCRPLRTSSLSATEFNCAHSSGNCFNLMPSRKWQIPGRLSRQLSFIRRNEGKTKAKERIDNNNNNGCPAKDVPKGFIAVYVGDMQEEQKRFVIPVFLFKSSALHAFAQGSGGGLWLQSERRLHHSLS